MAHLSINPPGFSGNITKRGPIIVQMVRNTNDHAYRHITSFKSSPGKRLRPALSVEPSQHRPNAPIQNTQHAIYEFAQRPALLTVQD